MTARKPDAFDAELGQLRKAFQAVAEWHKGPVGKMVMEASECLTVDSDDPDDKRDAATNAYLAAVEKLSDAKTPAAAGALEDIADAVSKSMARMAPQPKR